MEVFQKVHDKIQEIFGPIVDWFKEKFETAVAIIKLVFGAIVDFFQGIWDGIKAIFEPVIDWFKEKFETAWLVIKLVWEAVTDFFSGIWEGIKNVFSGVVDWFKEKFETAWLTIKFIWEAVTDFFSGIWEGVKNVFSTVGQFFKDAFQKAWDNIKAVFNGITDFFKGIWDKITGVFKSVGTKIADAFTGAFKKVVNGVFEFIEDKINGFIDMINGVIHLINNIPGVDLGDIGHVNLPRLEKGGILKKGQVGLLEGTGAEAVVPLESDTDGLKKIAGILAKEMQSSNVVYNNNSGDTVTNYNFTQNNSSPKALSRYDIYRQTRNLINAAKGV